MCVFKSDLFSYFIMCVGSQFSILLTVETFLEMMVLSLSYPRAHSRPLLFLYEDNRWRWRRRVNRRGMMCIEDLLKLVYLSKNIATLPFLALWLLVLLFSFCPLFLFSFVYFCFCSSFSCLIHLQQRKPHHTFTHPG